jgi:hypothetical protein
MIAYTGCPPETVSTAPAATGQPLFAPAAVTVDAPRNIAAPPVLVIRIFWRAMLLSESSVAVVETVTVRGALKFAIVFIL